MNWHRPRRSNPHWPKISHLLAMVAAILCVGSCSKPAPTLNLLVWEGYADPSFIKTFEKQNHCKVTASYMGSSDELMAKLHGGSSGNYDVISPSSDVAASVVSAGLAAPLDLTKIPSYSQLSPQLTLLPLVRGKGQVYGVPFMWGPDPIIYDTTAFAQPPDSWNVFWDPKYKGKVSVWDDLSTVYMAAQVLGYDRPDPSRLYNLSDQQLEAVKKKLLELKPNVRKMWSTGGELTNLFESHEIVIAMGWPLNTADLKKAGFPVGETIPKENTTGWIDHLMITAGSENKELAHKFLEYMIQAQTQKLVTDKTHYVPANPQAGRLMTPDEVKTLHLDDVENYQKRLYFWQSVPRRAKYTEIWNDVKAAQ
ncbi:MAG TPA: ABC transporter substrate-binding protein [Candidatus Sulfotelmatobacter sp.]|jgi:putative spermidine/putrescine transport system substrate-binding protein/spermidine/putrescine transport system substrate-binding protein